VTSVKVLSNPSLVVIKQPRPPRSRSAMSCRFSTGSATVLTTKQHSRQYDRLSATRASFCVCRPAINVQRQLSRLDRRGRKSATFRPANRRPVLTPTVSERKVRSSIFGGDRGKRSLLAGLISEQQKQYAGTGFPCSIRFPGLGDGFSHQDKKNTRTELIIFIRPQIIRGWHGCSFRG